MRDEFKVHQLNAQGLRKAANLGEVFSQALEAIELLVPQGRERSIVVTKLQEASFFAKRAIALDPANQEPLAAEGAGIALKVAAVLMDDDPREAEARVQRYGSTMHAKDWEEYERIKPLVRR